jgi:hypothetical protein
MAASAVLSGSADIIPGHGEFSLIAVNSSFTGVGTFGPSNGGPCISIPCAPGAFLNSGLSVISSEGGSLAGIVSLDGASYAYQGSPSSATYGSVDFHYFLTLTVPSGSPPSTLVLTAPFTADAYFASPFFNSRQALQWYGGGTVTLTFRRAFPLTQTLYQFQSAHFDFVPIPEPRTFAPVLTGLVLMGAAWIRVNRRIRRVN